jgi:hypothetical protein
MFSLIFSSIEGVGSITLGGYAIFAWYRHQRCRITDIRWRQCAQIQYSRMVQEMNLSLGMAQIVTHFSETWRVIVKNVEFSTLPSLFT